MRRLAALQESDEESNEDEGDGTAKLKGNEAAAQAKAQQEQQQQQQQQPQSIARQTNSGDWRNSLSQNRLSSFFEGWLRPTSPTGVSGGAAGGASNRNSAIYLPEARKSVSEPILMAQTTGGASSAAGSETPSGEGLDPAESADFEAMLVCVLLLFFFFPFFFYFSWRDLFLLLFLLTGFFLFFFFGSL